MSPFIAMPRQLLAPVGAASEEVVKAFGLGLFLDLLRARHHQRANAGRHLAPAHHARRQPQVGDPRIAEFLMKTT
jgi:hypothetical protein